MIINGNYKFIDIESLKPRLIEAFTRYYGEEYRSVISYRINGIDYCPYHTIEYVTDYYNQYINVTHREDLANIFFELIGRERTPELESLILPNNYDENPEIYMAVCGGYDVCSCSALTREGIEYIYKARENIRDAFGLEGDDYEVYKQIKDMYNKYIMAEKEVGKRFPCDVVDDVELFSHNSVEALKEYLRKAKDLGYDVSFDDIASVTKEDFTPNDVPLLHCRQLLFGDELMEKGTIASFTSENNQILENGSTYDKVEIIIERLKYLSAFHTPFKYIEYDELYEPTDKDDFIDRLFKEYEYQKKMPTEVGYVDYFNFNLEEVKENYKKGQFFPTDMADKLEDFRYEAMQEIVTDCKFYEKREPYPINMDFEYFTIYDYKDRNIYEPFSAIYINEDYTLNEEDLIRILLHEVNHAVGHGVPFSLNDKKSTFNSKAGLNNIVKYFDDQLKVSFDYPSPIYLSSAMQRIEENINERQTVEIQEIFMEDDISLGFDEDTIYKGKKDDYACAYNRYDFLLDDFYEIFYDAIRENKINTSYQFYFKHDLNTSKSEKIISHIKNKFNRLGSKSYSEEGVVDFYKVERLANVIEEFYQKVVPWCEMKSRELGRKLQEEDLDENIKLEIEKLKNKKDKIIKEMLKDTSRINTPYYYANITNDEMIK